MRILITWLWYNTVHELTGVSTFMCYILVIIIVIHIYIAPSLWNFSEVALVCECVKCMCCWFSPVFRQTCKVLTAVVINESTAVCFSVDKMNRGRICRGEIGHSCEKQLACVSTLAYKLQDGMSTQDQKLSTVIL